MVVAEDVVEAALRSQDLQDLRIQLSLSSKACRQFSQQQVNMK